MKRVLRRVTAWRFGRRGSFLLLFGFAWSALGYAWLATSDDAAPLGIKPLLYIAPFRTFAAMWLLCGVAALGAAFFRRPGQDTFGFMALTLPLSLWATSYATTYLLEGDPRILIGALVYALLGCAVLIVTGWPEPPPPNGDGKDE